MKCDWCDKETDHLKAVKNNGSWLNSHKICARCYRVVPPSSPMAKVFEPYRLEQGWIQKLCQAQPDWPGMEKEGRWIDIKSSEHERATFKAMSEASGWNVHYGEPGEKPGGHEFGRPVFDGKPTRKIYSFLKG